jgi:hypothetical protein
MHTNPSDLSLDNTEEEEEEDTLPWKRTEFLQVMNSIRIGQIRIIGARSEVRNGNYHMSEFARQVVSMTAVL